MSKKAQNVQEDSRCKGLQGNTSKAEIKCVCLNARSIINKKNELNIMVDDSWVKDIQTELIKQFGPKARDWLLRFFNNCTETKKIPKIWRQAKVVALLKPGKDPSVAKSFRPISLLCHTYKLFERLILNRIAEDVDAKLIPEHAGFCPGKSCTSQLLNLT